MRKINVIIFVVSALIVSCSSNEESIDRQKPTIDISNSIFKECVKVKKGVPFNLTADFKDNVALAAYSIDIHHNFDHHTHSTEVQLNECELNPKKEAENPFIMIKTYQIKGGVKNFSVNKELTIPVEKESGNYHFMLKVTDHEGWTTLKGLSFEVID